MSDDVETWLAIALRDAEPARRAQLRAEILDHLAEASTTYQAGGLDPAAARAAALADLGDPQHTARALRRAVRQPFAVRLVAVRTRWGLPLFLALMALLARDSLQRPLSLLGSGGDVSPTTGMALILQVAALTLALSLPLLFDDLDLSVGVVVLLGTYLVRVHSGSHSRDFWLAGGPEALPWVLLWAALAGAAVGLIHGLLIIALRLPASVVTLAGGVTLSTVLLRQRGINQLSLGSPERIPTLMPTLVLFGTAIILLCLFAVVAARIWQRPDPIPDPAPTARERLTDLLQGVWLGLPLTLTFGYVRLTQDEVRALPFLACVGGATVLGLAWVCQPEDAGVRRAHVRRLVRLVRPPVLLILGVYALVVCIETPVLTMQLFVLLLLTLLAILVALAMVIVLRAVWGSRGRHWLGIARPPQQAALARVAALVLSSGIAAALGGCIAAQGTRDGTTVNFTAFYVLVPLAGLIIGGQHRLPIALRPLGALLGALVVAGVTPLGSDNLDSPALVLVLTALFACAWRFVLPPARSTPTADKPERQPHLA